MRTDVTIDKKQVHCPNASTLGYGKYKAKFGYIVLFRTRLDPKVHAGHEDCGPLTIGRVIGRIAYAPRLDNDPDLTGHIVVMALGSNLTFPMERWIDPADVVECYDPADCGKDIPAFMGFFFGDSFMKQDVQSLRSYAAGESLMPAVKGGTQ